jgi:hypothetical protein
MRRARDQVGKKKIKLDAYIITVMAPSEAVHKVPSG